MRDPNNKGLYKYGNYNDMDHTTVFNKTYFIKTPLELTQERLIKRMRSEMGLSKT